MDSDDESPPLQKRETIQGAVTNVYGAHREGRIWVDEQRDRAKKENEAKTAADRARRYPPTPMKYDLQYGQIFSWAFAKNQCAKVVLAKIFEILCDRHILWWNGFFQSKPTEKFGTPEAILMNIRQVLCGPKSTQNKLVIMYTQMVHEGYVNPY